MAKLHYSPSLGRLSRCTSDNCPFEHFDAENMKRMAPVMLMGSPSVMKNSFQGIRVLPQAIAPALNQLRSAMSPKLFENIIQNRVNRDGASDHYHVTTIRPNEFRALKREGKSLEVTKPFHFELKGVGTVSNEKTQVWYAVADSVSLDQYRYSLGLPRLDYHVTLGFTVSDIHDLPKGEKTLI